MNQCPHCNKPVKLDSIWCPHCGNRLLIQTEVLSLEQRIDNVRSVIFGVLRFLIVLSITIVIVFAIWSTFLIWLWQTSKAEPIPPEFGFISVQLVSLIQSVITFFDYLHEQYGDLLQFIESIASLAIIAFGLLIFSFLGVFESILRLPWHRRRISSSYSQPSEVLNAKVMDAIVYGDEEWGNENNSVPFNCISLTIKINNKNASSRYIRFIKLESEFIGKHGLMSIEFDHNDDTFHGYSYTASNRNLLWAVTILPLRNLLRRMLHKQNVEAYISPKSYAEAPLVDIEAVQKLGKVLTTWLFERYTNEPFTLSKWIDMSTLPDIFFLHVIVKFSDELIHYQRKHQYAGNKVTIHIITEDGSTILTKPVDFKSSRTNDDEYERIQQLIK